MIYRRVLHFVALFACVCALLLPSGMAMRGQGHYLALAEVTAGAEADLPNDTEAEPESGPDRLVKHWLTAYIAPTLTDDGSGPPPRKPGMDDLRAQQSPQPRHLESGQAHRWTDADGNPILGSTYMQSLAHVFPLAHLPT